MVVKEGMKWYLLIVTTLSTFVLLADPALTPLMISPMKIEFELSQTAAIWIINAYYVAFASFLLLGGRLCEILGYRNMYKGGAAIFSIGALTCALSGDFFTLIIGRVVEGIGAGLNMPALAAMIIASFPKEERGRALAIDSGVAGFLVLISVFFSGYVIQYLSWHVVYASFVAFSTLGIILSIFVVKPATISFIRFPIYSPLILILGMVITTAALMEAGRANWHEPIFIAGLFGGPILLIIFVVYSLYAKEPLADFRLFKEPVFFWVNFLRMLVFFLLAASNLWVIYFGSNLKYSPSTLGVLIFIAQLPTLLTSLAGGYISDRFSYRASLGLGFFLMVFCFSWIVYNYDTKNVWQLMPALLAFTGASPILISQSVSLGLSKIPTEQLGSMSGLMATVQQFAQAIGLAFLMTIFIEIETATKSDLLAFLGLNVTALAFALLGLLITLLKIPNERL